MSQACVEWHGDIGAYVVGALSPAEAGPVLRHLRGCTGCRADYQDLVPVRDWLGRLGPADGMPARPPLDRLPLEPAHPLHHQVTRRRWTVAGVAVAAAVIAVIALISARPDGQTQLTYNGKPLYTFRLDVAPGQAHGNNFTDHFGSTSFTWRAITTSGSPAGTGQPGNGGGYAYQSSSPRY